MFKNFASDALGLSDIGKIVAPSQFHQTDIDEYIFHEDQERIYFVIKSKMDEYCFTNTAFIHLDGQSATSKKRTLKRYAYRHYPPSQVVIETAGTMDLDVELKFFMGDVGFSIDIDKNQLEGVRDIYKALTAIASQCLLIKEREAILDKSFERVLHLFALKQLPEAVILNLPDIINQTIHQVQTAHHQNLTAIRQYDFGAVFEHYLQH